MRRLAALVATHVAAALLILPALAVEPSEMLPDPALEARARDIGRALRCVVCQNQSIDDSNAEVAHDMRRAVRERLVAGDDDRKVFAYMVARYGDYVLLKPPFKPGTLVLWLGGPVVLLVAGGALLLAARRRKPATPPPPLDETEQQRLDLILRNAALRAAPQDEDIREKPHPEERPQDASRSGRGNPRPLVG